MKHQQVWRCAGCIVLLTLLGTGCTFSPRDWLPSSFAALQRGRSDSASAEAIPRAQSTFMARLPSPLAEGQTLALAVLDEVTGLALNAEFYPMQPVDPVTYKATLALPHRATVKYRYVRLGATQVAEDDPLDNPIRYRMYSAAAPGEVTDIVAGWSDAPNVLPTGSIQGRVLNADTGDAIPDILVTAGGIRAFTDSAGRFDLQGVSEGTHNLVAYSVDGTFETFQQGTTVARALNTAVEISLRAAPLVRITFLVSAPSDVQGAPIRIAGNLAELGNTFADLRGGMSTVAERMPVMEFQPDGRYRATLSLPANSYVRYKYTFGDGYWNAEHATSGLFRLREFVVPTKDMVLNDTVDSWSAGDKAPILFNVSVPPNTPASDILSIQFSTYGWSEPIPMWPLGSGRWIYKLYGPLGSWEDLHYRYCRSGQCGSADDLATAGASAQGRVVTTGTTPQEIMDTVGEWAWLGETEPGTLVGAEIDARSEGFVAGIELQPGYQPNWAYYNPQAVQAIQALGANWMVFTPGWTYSGVSPLVFGILPRDDPFWLDSTIMISHARAANLKVAIFPTPRFTISSDTFWSSAPVGPAWWQTWFEHYRAFLVHHADLAERTGSQALILGGDWSEPALPSGTLPDGSPSMVPADAALRWNAIITEVRQHYSGAVWWALPMDSSEIASTLDLAASTDAVYLMLGTVPDQAQGEPGAPLADRIQQQLDGEVATLASVVDRPIILAISYPSAKGVENGCIPVAAGCLDWQALIQPYNPEDASVDLHAQGNVYGALLGAVNSRQFIDGVVSRGFFPPTILQDKSASVRGKPAADILWYWFPRLSGTIQ